MELVIEANVKPLAAFIALLKHFTETRERFFDSSDLTFELARIESNYSSTDTDKLVVTLYPSDCFLNFVATFFTSEGDFNVV